MMQEIQQGRGYKHESGVDCLKLHLTHLGADNIKERRAGIKEIGMKFSGIDVIEGQVVII